MASKKQRKKKDNFRAYHNKHMPEKKQEENKLQDDNRQMKKEEQNTGCVAKLIYCVIILIPLIILLYCFFIPYSDIHALISPHFDLTKYYYNSFIYISIFSLIILSSVYQSEKILPLIPNCAIGAISFIICSISLYQYCSSLNDNNFSHSFAASYIFLSIAFGYHCSKMPFLNKINFLKGKMTISAINYIIFLFIIMAAYIMVVITNNSIDFILIILGGVFSVITTNLFNKLSIFNKITLK